MLTGSANLMALPTVADSLAGRMETLLLLPLSQSEIKGQSVNWLDRVFSGQIPQQGTQALGEDLVDRVLRGGYPEAIARSTARRRIAWARNRLNRVVKSAKLQFIDSGLLATLLELTAEEVQQDRTRFGNVLESFIYGELLKATTTAEGNY